MNSIERLTLLIYIYISFPFSPSFLTDNMGVLDRQIAVIDVFLYSDITSECVVGTVINSKESPIRFGFKIIKRNLS